MPKRSIFAGAWIAMAVAGLYGLTIPGNHSEAEDAFAYARMVEAPDAAAAVHPHHVLYGPIQVVIYRALRLAWPSLRAFPVMVGVSLFCAAACCGLFHDLCRRCGIASPWRAAVPTVGLATSYGFWRYACEAEIYASACLAIVALFGLASRGHLSRTRSFSMGTLAGAGILLHVLVLAPATGLGLALLARTGRRTALLYLAGMITTASVGYLAAAPALVVRGADAGHALDLAGVSKVASLREMTSGVPRALLHSAVGLGQCVVSGNFLFAYERAAARLQDIFPGRQFDEERYAGQRAPWCSRWLPPLTLAGIAGLGLVCLWAMRPYSGTWRRDRPDAARESALLGPAAVLSVGLHALMVMALEPGNPEMWIMILVPLWLAIAIYVLRPADARQIRVACTTVGLLAIHNLVGGLWVVRDPAGDYNRQKAAWIAAHAGEEATIVTADSQVFVRYLRYRSRATVEDLTASEYDNLAAAWGRVADTGAIVWVMADVVHPPRYLRAHNPTRYAALVALGRRVRPALQKVHDDEFGGVFTLSNESSTL